MEPASYDLLRTLCVQPILGRLFTKDDDQPGHDHVVILSYSLWQRQFNADDSIIGKRVHLTGQDLQDYEVIGVMSAEFNYPLVIPTSINPPSRQMAYWIPFGLDFTKQSRNGASCMAIARLRAGVTIAQAQTDMDAITNQLAKSYPQSNTGRRARIVPFNDFVLGNAREAMLLVWAATAVVILIACANIASLLLARSINRQREIGIRLPLAPVARDSSDSGLQRVYCWLFLVVWPDWRLRAFHCDC